jgi:hypothetical protein
MIIKHLTLDEKAGESFGGRFVAFSCETDTGKRTTIRNMLNLGNGSVILFPCDACMAEIESQILKPLITEAIKHGLKV